VLSRYLDVLVLSNTHYYHDTPLVLALRSSRAIRFVEKSRWRLEFLEDVNTIFLDPGAFASDDGFDGARDRIEFIREKYPQTVIVLCAGQDSIDEFLQATGNRFRHYFQLDYTKVGAAPDSLVEEVVKACQVEVDRNIRARFAYDIAISFAGEQRTFAEAIARGLRERGVSVFYDDFERADLWGRDLYAHLHDIYSNKAQYCIMLASYAYANKVWTNHERQAAQQRALQEKGAPYILPVRCDDTDIPGLSRNIAHLTKDDGASAICARALVKMGVMDLDGEPLDGT